MLHWDLRIKQVDFYDLKVHGKVLRHRIAIDSPQWTGNALKNAIRPADIFSNYMVIIYTVFKQTKKFNHYKQTVGNDVYIYLYYKG